MPINYLNDEVRRDSQSVKFGICDDDSCYCAYVDEVNPSLWIAEVSNPNKKTINFYPIDHCVEVYRPNGELDNHCDGLLRSGNDLMFVELKDRVSHGWIAQGLLQLKVSIANFKKYHSTDDFDVISARLCNKQRPMAVVSCRREIEEFKKDTGYIVQVDRRISF